MLQGSAKEISIGEDGVLWLQGRLCVPNVDGLRERILDEAHCSRYSIHPGATKMYRDLRQHYWWRRMKKDIVDYVAKCLNCQQSLLTTTAISLALRWLHLRLYMFGSHSPIGWFEPGEAKLYGTDLVQDALDKVKLIQERLRTAQSKQKSYTD
ncbi:uncharacterized protein [Nicotiana sylvestris]|uniref:uncharacterized protein n=1 Tax=Nicotiana sylvestris TaxID=4096 RepID=UPI00388C3D4D